MGLLQKIKENKMGEFNEAQVAAIKHKKGPMLVLAGAGSGKTTVLTYRIKNLIMNREVNPKNILVLTFTKAAAKEMEERFHGMMPKRNQVTFGTFHSVFLRILVKHGGYSYKNIVSPRVQTDIIQRAATELDHYLGSGFQECMDKTKEIILNIELIKNHRIKDVKEISEKELELKNMSADTAWQFYQYYQNYMQQKHMIDFTDMLLLTYNLFKEKSDVLDYYRDLYRYIMVDEYQDTNPIQNDIIMLLAEPRNNLFCVGDDDQSIYGFRGAEPSIMLQFPKEFEHAKVIQLPLNYRCKENIVQASNRLISFNKNRYNKRILAARTENPTDADVIFHAYDKYSEECNYVKNVLLGNDKQAAMIGNVPYGDTACLFRTNRSVEKFAGKLIDSEIPFYSLEPLRNMLDHFVAKQIMAYFEVAMGNEKNLYEIVNRPVRYVEKRYVKPSTTLAQLKSIYANADSDKSYVYENLLKLEEDLHILKELGTPSKMIQYFFSEEGINYKKHLNNCSKIMHMTEEDIDDLKETTNQLYIFFRKYDTMDNLKKGIKQYTRMIQDAYKNQDRVGKVALTTIHSSKGLEYQRVIIFDVNEENLPYRKVDEKTDIEEERRLMYVAITRAKDQVIILYNNKNASQFVSQSQLAKSDFKVGDMILHKAFGKGRIVNTDSKYIQIEFPEKNRTMKFNFEYAITKNIIKKL